MRQRAASYRVHSPSTTEFRHQPGVEPFLHFIRRNTTSVFDAMFEEVRADALPVPAGANASGASAIAAICLTTTGPTQATNIFDPSAIYCDAMSDALRPAFGNLVTDEQQIQLDLGLVPGLCAEQVSQLRRQFALRNHPDLVPPRFRQLATLRMTIANALCDAYRG